MNQFNKFFDENQEKPSQSRNSASAVEENTQFVDSTISGPVVLIDDRFWTGNGHSYIPAVPGKVIITAIGPSKVQLIKAIRTYTRPHYSLTQAKQVLDQNPGEVDVTDLAAFCRILRPGDQT